MDLPWFLHQSPKERPPQIADRRRLALPRVCACCGRLTTRKLTECPRGGHHSSGQGATFHFIEALALAVMLASGCVLAIFGSGSSLAYLASGMFSSLYHPAGDVALWMVGLGAILVTTARRWIVRRQKQATATLATLPTPRQELKYEWYSPETYQIRGDHAFRWAIAYVGLQVAWWVREYNPSATAGLVLAAGMALFQITVWEARVRPNRARTYSPPIDS